MKTLELLIKSEYGNTRMYPNCELSEQFAQLTGTKTFTPSNLKHIRALGFNIDMEYKESGKQLHLQGTE